MEFSWSFQVGPLALRATRQDKTYCCHLETADEALAKAMKEWLTAQKYKIKKVPKKDQTIILTIPHGQHKSHISPIRRAMAELVIHNSISVSLQEAPDGRP